MIGASMPAHAVSLAAITLLAAIVNGALGYGFSSITVPLALLFLTNRVLNPALVIIDVHRECNDLFLEIIRYGKLGDHPGALHGRRREQHQKLIALFDLFTDLFADERAHLVLFVV